MTGRIQSIEANRVTISGATYDFGEAVRWVLERSERDGWEVEVVVIGGKVVQAMRVAPTVRHFEIGERVPVSFDDAPEDLTVTSVDHAAGVVTVGRRK